MRLWHQALIPKLPRPQLLGQHRECCALRGKTCPAYVHLEEVAVASPIYPEHDAAYYEECLQNLREKGTDL